MNKGSEAIKLIPNGEEDLIMPIPRKMEVDMALSVIKQLKDTELLSEREYTIAKKRAKIIKQGM